ncbi:MAG: hypothetical protein AAFR71_02880 [Pseudomonadota bacterium]
MQETLFVLTVLGCNDTVTQCRTMETEQIEYASIDECYANSEAVMIASADTNYPVFLARCDTPEVAKRAYGHLGPESVDNIVTAELQELDLAALSEANAPAPLPDSAEPVIAQADGDVDAVAEPEPKVAVAAAPAPAPVRPGVWYRVKPRAAIAKVAKPVKGVAEEAGDVANSAARGAKKAWEGTTQTIRRLNPF